MCVVPSPPYYSFVFISFDVVRKAVLGMMAMKRMTTLANHLTPEQKALEHDLFQYKEESEKVRFLLIYSLSGH
jgi:calcium/calmodulin-dependent protein kinase I